MLYLELDFLVSRSSKNNQLLFVISTNGRPYFCGYRLVLGSRSATRCCRSFLTSLEVSIVLRWTEQFVHTYCDKPSPSSIGSSSSRLRRPGRSSFSPFWLNNKDDRFGDTSDEQTLHVQSLTKAALIAVH